MKCKYLWFVLATSQAPWFVTHILMEGNTKFQFGVVEIKRGFFFNHPISWGSSDWILSALEVTNMWACGSKGHRTPTPTPDKVHNLISVPRHLILFLDHENFAVHTKYLVPTGMARHAPSAANLQLAFNTPPPPFLTRLLLPALRNSYLGRYGFWGKQNIDRSLKFKPCATEDRSCLQRDLLIWGR